MRDHEWLNARHDIIEETRFFSSYSSFYLLYLESLSHLFLRRSPRCGTSRSLLLFFSSCVHTQSSFTRDKTQTRTDSFYHFSQTIFLRFLHLHTRYNKIHIRECHSTALFHLYSLSFSRSLSLSPALSLSFSLLVLP